jgi:hypothetical protein
MSLGVKVLRLLPRKLKRVGTAIVDVGGCLSGVLDEGTLSRGKEGCVRNYSRSSVQWLLNGLGRQEIFVTNGNHGSRFELEPRTAHGTKDEVSPNHVRSTTP